jgi:cyanophycinase
MGVDHFSRLGAQVRTVAVIDKESANDPEHASMIEEADLIYFSGGDPGYLHQTMKDSLAWTAAQTAWSRGAVYAGCSAGAMILAREIPDFRALGLRSIRAFGILPAAFVIPHFDAIPAIWRPLIAALRRRLKEGDLMIGVDENTALVGRLNGTWSVMGESSAHLFRKDEVKTYDAGESFSIAD